MPVSTRTRTNNLTNTSRQSHSVPKFYRLYLEDISALSNKIKHLSLALDATHPYTYDFAFYLFGQQVLQDFPLTLATTKLSDAIFDESMIEIASIHYAINLTHVDPNHSVFRGTERTSAYLSGARTQKHPIFGLYQIANITSAMPRNLTHLIPPTDDTTITYAQAYTPFTKGLLTNILGKEYIEAAPHMHQLYESTILDRDYSQIRESIIFNLYNSVARIEVVLSSQSVLDLLNFRYQSLVDDVADNLLLIQVSTGCNFN